MHNTDRGWGWMAKALHWAIFLLFITQFVVAFVMLNMPSGDVVAGFTQGALYEWHKSLGLVALTVALGRFLWRKLTSLPDWAPNLSAGEKRTIGVIEPLLYACMFLMPVSGYLFVMTGGFGVKLFNSFDLPRVPGENETFAHVAQFAHSATATILVLTLLAHWIVIFRHESRHSDGYLARMLPGAQDE